LVDASRASVLLLIVAADASTCFRAFAASSAVPACLFKQAASLSLQAAAFLASVAVASLKNSFII